MPKVMGLALLLGLCVIGVACEEESPAECDLDPQGDFLFSLDPRLPSGPDSTADIERTITGAVLDTIMVAPNFIPPLITYRFHAPGFSRLDIRLIDLLVEEETDPAQRGFPVVKGETYTLDFELTQQVVPPSMSIRISDGEGVRFFGVNDWRPAETTGAQIHESGYPEIDGAELRVLFSEVGCETQDVDFDCYQEFTNRRLDFLIGNNGPLELFSNQRGTLGPWDIFVYKAAKVVAKAGCTESLLRQNGVSFTLERAGLR
ncbi:MAG TPA: hypothetical protein VFP10_00030 [Candidatus Eisenbacteria bacterium]|nr:hypothetical protein [Candidatus Eisenbacteria bacterium]